MCLVHEVQDFKNTYYLKINQRKNEIILRCWWYFHHLLLSNDICIEFNCYMLKRLKENDCVGQRGSQKLNKHISTQKHYSMQFIGYSSSANFIQCSEPQCNFVRFEVLKNINLTKKVNLKPQKKNLTSTSNFWDLKFDVKPQKNLKKPHSYIYLGGDG